MDKNVVLGVVSFITVIALVIVLFQTGRSRNTPIDPSEIPRISAEAVKNKLDAGSNLVIIDTRSAGEYEPAHIAGAISIPLAEIAQRYAELKGYDEIITYCT
ncbi:MAG: hypothetical protein HYU85_08530 [Chloroflexi bacterium]|nr:hypothetical protein [Chloroflexota bacterium]